MKDADNNQVQVGDSVQHRFQNYNTGVVEKIEEGCNALCWVDFGQTVSNKKHLTVCCKDDIIKQ